MTFWVPIYMEATGLSVGTTGYLLIAPSVATTCVYGLAMKFDKLCKKWLRGLITGSSFMQMLSIAGLLVAVTYGLSWKVIIGIFTVNMAVATNPTSGINIVVLKPLHWLAEKQIMSNAAEQKFTGIGQITTHTIGGLGLSLSVSLAQIAYQSTNRYIWVFVLSVSSACVGLVFFIILMFAPKPWPKGWEPVIDVVKKLPVLGNQMMPPLRRTTSLDERTDDASWRRRQPLLDFEWATSIQ